MAMTYQCAYETDLAALGILSNEGHRDILTRPTSRSLHDSDATLLIDSSFNSDK